MRRPAVALATSVLTLLVLGLAGCNRPRFDNPVDAYVSFARAIQKGELQLAWEALSTETRAVFEQRAKAVSDASGGAVRADPIALVFSPAPPAPMKHPRVSREEGEGVVILEIEGEQPDEPALIRMVREPSGWKLDLRDSLKQ
jgi:hypothetical protein